jgi:CRISPR/Cas system-associated exonuclease Cas4 (RecB family)
MAPITTKEPLNFKKMFDGWVADTQKKWGHDRKKTLGGSEAFGCLRKAWYKRNGTPYDPDYEESWGALRRGDIIENYLVVPAMEWAAEHFGFELMMAGATQITLFDKATMVDVLDEKGEVIGEEPGGLSVTPDGLIRGVARNALAKYGIPDIGTDCFMLEVKSIDPRVDLSEEKSIHHGQVQIQMGLMRENTAFKPNYAVILYINASFLDDIEVFVVKFDEKKYKIAKDRARYIFKTTDPNKLAREGVIDGTCQYCPFQGTCMKDVQGSMPAAPATKNLGNPELIAIFKQNGLLDRHRQAQKAFKKAEATKKAIGEEIKVTLREHGQSKLKNGDEGWSISYSMSQGRKALSKSAIEEAGLDPEDFMKVGNPFEILKVTFTDMTEDDE